VICLRDGSHDGKRGKVVERMGEAIHVEFPTSSTVDHEDYFEAVTTP